MTTSNLTAINPITATFEALAKNPSDRKAYDFLVENYNDDVIKRELIYFSKTYLLSTVESEIESSKKYKRKLMTFEDLVKYLIKNVCSKDNLRPAMNSVYYDQKNNNLAATDAHILIKLPIKNLPISDKLDNICSIDGIEYKLYNYQQNSFKLDKYNDLINEEISGKYPDINAVLPKENYTDFSYFSISPYLFNGLKVINKIAKKFKIVQFPVKLSCLENKAFLNLSLLCRYIDLHQKIYGNYAFMCFTRNTNNIGTMLYNVNVDVCNIARLLIMPIIVDESESSVLDLNL
jgi:hypothetical protein